MSKVLVIDDEASLRELLSILLGKGGHEVRVASNGELGLAQLQEMEPDVVFTDLKMPGQIGGLEVLRKARELYPATQVVMMTAFASMETAIQAMKLGAYDYIEKPFKIEEIEVILSKCLEKRALLQENVSLRSALQERYHFGKLLGKSDEMQRVFSLLEKVCDTKVNVLILGENGTGKELVARALHYNGARRDRGFVAVNCGAIPEPLLESELFGHQPGAFTGASRKKPGLFEVADGGTLFLDEIGEMPLQMQVKLLRVLQEKQIRPVGGTKIKDVDVRIIAATNKKLEAEVKAGNFREDLFFRLNVFSIEMPSLRSRREDIPLLAQNFVAQFAQELQKDVTGISQKVMELLMRYDYPGNVRELKNAIEHAVLMESGEVLQPPSLPKSFLRAEPFLSDSSDELALPEEGLESFLERIEGELLFRALEQAGGVRKEAARLLGISFRSFRYRLAKYEDAQKLENEGGTDEKKKN